MSEKDWICGPIWKEIYQFLDIATEGGNDGALALYDSVQGIINGDTQGAAAFLSRLSPSQSASLRIIQEWWDCTIEEDEWFRTTTDRRKHLEVLYHFPTLEHASPLVVQILLGVGPLMPQISTYRLEVFRLFQMEFDHSDLDIGGVGDEVRALGFLQKQRERAAFYASVQRTTFAFRPNIEASTASSNRPDKGKQKVEASHPHSLFSGAHIGACVEACPWLRFRKSRSGYPFFLWDTQAQRTAIVDEMDTEPEYICISHTWGRWLNSKAGPTEVPGVPWLVPQNTIFRVLALPERLRTAFPVKYIWLDLFCIPQDMSERALIEIARQADIFGNAVAAVAWLNDIDDWTGLRQTTEWLCRFCLNSYGTTQKDLPETDVSQSTGLIIGDGDTETTHSRTPGGWFTSLWTLQEACLRPDMFLCNKNFELFAIGGEKGLTTVVSLDSLAALTNFMINSYDHGPFEMILNSESTPQESKPGTVLEYEDLNRSSPKRQRWILEKLPEHAVGVVELYDALVTSGMNKLFKVSPVSILNLGKQRQCTSRRAEAIMSVIGATDWYVKHVKEHKTSPAETDLVLGYYPLAFLNEIASKLGAPFFASVSSNLETLQGAVDIAEAGEDETWRPRSDPVAVGSLLPFIPGQTTMLTAPEYEPAATRDHPSVRTWTILRGGEVRIPEAGIVITSFAAAATANGGKSSFGEEPLRASILVPGVFSTTAARQCDLREWVRTFRAGGSRGSDGAEGNGNGNGNVAVSLYQPTRKFHWGLILKQVGSGNRLVKIGTFFTDALTVDDLPSQAVDWVVL